ncbi:MAG TPA: MFS transporter [Trebonia sp.]|jgi:ACS family tartrate transporter-like MFS transporter|nr:MFS transporter [Trebonia sp.]
MDPTSSQAPPADLGPAEQRQVVRKVGLRILPLLMLAYFLNSLDKTNISLAALDMNKALGLTDAAFGLASGLFFVGYFIFEVPSNLALTRAGPRRWIARIMVSWGIVAAATAFANGAVSLYVLRILLGVAEAGFYPGVLLYLTVWVPARYRARYLAYFVIGGSLAGVFGSPLSGWIISSGQALLGIAGWRAMFVLEGIPAIACGIITLAVIKDKPADAKWLAPREKEWLTGEIAREQQGVSTRHRGSGSIRRLMDARLALLSVAYFCKCYGQYALAFFLPQMIAAFEASDGHQSYSVMTVSLLTAIPSGAGIIASIPWAIHSDRTGERRWHAAIPLFVATAGVCVSAVVHQPFGIMAALCVGYIGIGCQSQVFFQLPSTFLTGAAAAGGLAMINAVGNLGGFAAPYVTGWLKEFTGTFTAASFVMGGVMALGGVLTILLPRIRAATPARSSLKEGELHA